MSQEKMIFLSRFESGKETREGGRDFRLPSLNRVKTWLHIVGGHLREAVSIFPKACLAGWLDHSRILCTLPGPSNNYP